MEWASKINFVDICICRRCSHFFDLKAGKRVRCDEESFDDWFLKYQSRSSIREQVTELLQVCGHHKNFGIKEEVSGTKGSPYCLVIRAINHVISWRKMNPNTKFHKVSSTYI